jgi:predicted Fe-Mo cluster-binding NifX family protein
MNICIPVDANNELQSQVCAHFGSAPVFMIVDTDTGSCHSVVNSNQHHAHGMCMPLESLRGQHIDGVVVGGIGRGALDKLNAANIRVYVAEHATVGEVITALEAGSLTLMQPDLTCAHHGHGHS